MKSKVYFIDFRATLRENLIDKLGRLLETAGVSGIIGKKDLTAVKIHFGELGNTAYINPVMIARVVSAVREAGGVPFLTDANTLYAGSRSDSPTHISTAVKNGFAYSVVENTPIIIADGLRGKSEEAIPVSGKHFSEVYIGTEIVQADSLISVAHFKGHELSGFGGAIKNLGMGCASRRGKLAQHSSVGPKVKGKRCVSCAICLEHCAHGAIAIEEGKKARIDQDRCVGCGECIIICPSNAVQIQWNRAIPTFLESMVEYTAGVLKGKEEKSLYINFITNVSPACDCLSYNDAPIVRDIGIVASKDPIAIDQACVDLVNNEHALPGTCLKCNTEPGEDKFKGLYPKVDWELQLEYGEEMGLGTRAYELETIDVLTWGDELDRGGSH